MSNSSEDQEHDVDVFQSIKEEYAETLKGIQKKVQTHVLQKALIDNSNSSNHFKTFFPSLRENQGFLTGVMSCCCIQTDSFFGQQRKMYLFGENHEVSIHEQKGHCCPEKKSCQEISVLDCAKLLDSKEETFSLFIEAGDSTSIVDESASNLSQILSHYTPSEIPRNMTLHFVENRWEKESSRDLYISNRNPVSAYCFMHLMKWYFREWLPSCHRQGKNKELQDLERQVWERYIDRFSPNNTKSIVPIKLRINIMQLLFKSKHLSKVLHANTEYFLQVKDTKTREFILKWFQGEGDSSLDTYWKLYASLHLHLQVENPQLAKTRAQAISRLKLDEKSPIPFLFAAHYLFDFGLITRMCSTKDQNVMFVGGYFHTHHLSLFFVDFLRRKKSSSLKVFYRQFVDPFSEDPEQFKKYKYCIPLHKHHKTNKMGVCPSCRQIQA